MQFKLNNAVIPLDAGTTLPLVLRSPLFLTDKGNIPGSYIFNFSVPAGIEIRKEFGQAHRVQKHGRATAELPYIIVDGLLRYTGNCIVTQATADSYEIACKIDNGDLTGKLSGKTLKNLAWGDDIVITDLYSLALARNFNVGYSDPNLEGYISFPVNESLTVIKDITSSIGGDGHTFASTQNTTCRQIIKLNVAFTTGALRLVAKKNNVSYFDQTYSIQAGGQLPPAEIANNLTLDAGDVITIELECITESFYPIGTEANIFVGLFQVEYKKTNIFTTVSALDQYDADFAIFPVHNPDFLSNFPDDAFQIDNLSIKTIYTNYFYVLNYWKDAEFPLLLSGVAENEHFVAANLFTPFVYMRTILLKIAAESGYTVENNPFDNEFKNMVLFNAYAENTYSGNTTTLLPIKDEFNLADHVPDIAQNDFLKWVSLLTGYMPVVDNNLQTIRFVDIKDKHVVSATNLAVPFPGIFLELPEVKTEPEYAGIKFELKKAGADQYLQTIKELNEKLVYKGTVAQITDLPASGNKVNDMYLVSAIDEYYVFQYNPDTYMLMWMFFSKKFPLLYSEGKESLLQITSELCPMLTSRMLDSTLSAPVSRNWTIPKTEQSGILEGFPDSLGSEYGLQVLYYKGKVNDSLLQPYPLGSCRMADYGSNPDSSPDLSADGIFNSRYKAWLQWLAYETKPVTIKAILTRAELRKVRFDQVYSAEGFNFLIKEVRINMGVDGLSVGEMDVYTC